MNFGSAYCTQAPPVATLQEFAAGPFLGEVDVELVQRPFLFLLRVDSSQGLLSFSQHKAFDRSLHRVTGAFSVIYYQSSHTHVFRVERTPKAPLWYFSKSRCCCRSRMVAALTAHSTRWVIPGESLLIRDRRPHPGHYFHIEWSAAA